MVWGGGDFCSVKTLITWAISSTNLTYLNAELGRDTLESWSECVLSNVVVCLPHRAAVRTKGAGGHTCAL